MERNTKNTELLNTFGISFKFKKDEINVEEIKTMIFDETKAITEFKKENFNSSMFNNFQKFIILRTIDEKWQDHLYTMDQLREGIGLRAYGQKNPLIEYKQEGFAMFEEMMVDTNKETLRRIFRTDLTTIGQQPMSINQRAENLKTKRNVNILSTLAKQNIQQTNIQNDGTPANQPFMPNKEIPQIERPNTPIKVEKKVGRNEPCPCGSGKKYKKCHGTN